MKVYRIDSYTGPAGLGLHEEPDPAPPTGHQVVVRVRASSLNYRELLDVQGALARMVPLPERRIPGSDAAGEVIAVGPDVTRVRAGDRVATTFYADWLRGPLPAQMNFIGRSAGQNDGTLTEQTVVHEDELVHLPAYLSFEEAATLPCAGVTAWTSLFVHADVRPGDTVLIEGSGGVSTMAIPLARMAGARVIATTTSPDKADRLRAIGAQHVVVARKDAPWSAQVLEASGGAGADWTLSTAGGDFLLGCIEATRPGGTLVTIGVRDSTARPVPAGAFALRGVRLHSTRVGSREHFEALNRALAANELRRVVERVFEFAEARAAFETFAAARHVGKIVIRHA